MVNRVCLGLKGSTFGIWVSKPGHDVLGASLDNMLFTSEAKFFQVVQTGQAALSGGYSGEIFFPNLGYEPMILLATNQNNALVTFAKHQFLSGNSFRIQHENLLPGGVASIMYYAVLSVRRYG